MAGTVLGVAGISMPQPEVCVDPGEVEAVSRDDERRRLCQDRWYTTCTIVRRARLAFEHHTKRAS